MVKNIKRSLKYFIIIFGILLVLPTILYFSLRVPAVQTYIVKRVISHLSEQIESTIEVGAFDFRFFNKLNINDILIKDANNDTLIFASRLTTGIRRVNFRSGNVILGRLTVMEPVVTFITDTSGVMNLRWYLDMLKSPDDSLKKRNLNIKINHIDISNARLTLVDRSVIPGGRGIEFNNLHLTGINGIIEDFSISNDTTTFSIYNLGFREAGGFTVNRFDGAVSISQNRLHFNSVSLKCDSTILNIPQMSILGDPSSSFNDFMNKVRLSIMIERSLISFTDLRYFVPALDGLNESVWASGRVSGTVSELRGRDIKINYRENSLLDCDFDFSGLPDIDNAFIHIGINTLKTNSEDINKLSLPDKAALNLPEFLDKLGVVSFTGSFTGFLTDFVAYGKLRSDAGMISTDLSLRPEEQNRYRIEGLLAGSDIALGYITGNNEMLGSISFSSNIDGYAHSLNDYSGNINAFIDSVEINGYKYQKISLKGMFSEKAWDGAINISEENIKMDLLGMFNFSSSLPEFNFTLNLLNADLHKLNFDKSDTTTTLSMLLTANFKGNSIDNLDGEIKILNSNLIKYGTSLDIYDFSIRTFTENNKPAISLRTDYVDADLRGDYNFSGLGTVFKGALASLMPSRFSSDASPENLKGNRFTFDINFKNTDQINNLFQTGILLSAKSTLSGIIYPDTLIKINGNAGSFSVMNNVFRDISLEATMANKELTTAIKSSSLNILGQSELKEFSFNLSTKPDNFTFGFNWDNNDEIINRGAFSARGAFLKNEYEGSNAVLNIEIDSTSVYTNNKLWKINRSSIVLDTTSVKVNKLYISNNEHSYMVSGAVSEDPSDTLHLEFSEIDIAPLNYLTKKQEDPDQIPLSFKGEINGNIMLTGIYHNPLIESNLQVNDFAILQSEYGTLSISTVWNSAKKVIDINAGNNYRGRKMIGISGFYDPEMHRIDLTATADQLPVDALNPLLKVFASGITGTVSGKLKLSGDEGKIVLKGSVMANNASMKVDYLQTRYTLNDSIRFDRNNIIFRNIRLTDERNNTAVLNGSVFHNYFKDFGADIMVNTKETMVLNTKPKDNELFYGTAFASGVTTIKSSPASLSFDISATTGKNTRFFIPLNSGETVTDYSFITFVSPDTSGQISEDRKNIALAPVNQTGIDLNFDLEVTPDAEVQLIFDEKTGDIMRGRGSGKLNINLDSKGEFRISGDYNLEEGDYLFTLGNIFNKPFSVENGGKITFRGNLDDAEIDMKAIYRLKASLYEILQDENFRERIPVECQINLSGNLFNPVIKLDIYLPMADEPTRAYLKNVITTEEEKSRQFLYLLVMNSFYSDPTYGTSLTSTTTGTSAMAVTTTEMISNQLSNWISQISNDFDLGFNYRPGHDINPQEVEVALSTQLLNDRVTINGNFDVRGTGATTTNSDQITGDFDIEYTITEKIRFRVFNRFNNPYTGKQAPYTQGFGLFFKQDFDRFSDLFRKKVKPEVKKEDEPEASDI